MVAERRLNKLLVQLQSNGLVDQAASTAIAMLVAKIEADMRDEFLNSPSRDNSKSWTSKVQKDDNVFKFTNKGSAESNTGFSAWKWYFELSVQQFAPSVLVEMKKAEGRAETITIDMINEPFVKANAELYYALVSCLEGDPLDVIKTCQDNGCEAWRRLCERYAINLFMQMMNQLSRVFCPPAIGKTSDVKKKVQEWENHSHVLLNEFKVPPPTGFAKIVLLLSMVPRKFTILTKQTMTEATTYEDIRASVWRQVDEEEDKRDGSAMQVDNISPTNPNKDEQWWQDNQGGWFAGALAQSSAGGSPQEHAEQQPQQQPHDLNAWYKGGKKGNGGKGTFNGTCYNCGEAGHRASQCPHAQKRLRYTCGADDHLAAQRPQGQGQGRLHEGRLRQGQLPAAGHVQGTK